MLSSGCQWGRARSLCHRPRAGIRPQPQPYCVAAIRCRDGRSYQRAATLRACNRAFPTPPSAGTLCHLWLVPFVNDHWLPAYEFSTIKVECGGFSGGSLALLVPRWLPPGWAHKTSDEHPPYKVRIAWPICGSHRPAARRQRWRAAPSARPRVVVDTPPSPHCSPAQYDCYPATAWTTHTSVRNIYIPATPADMPPRHEREPT